MEAQQFKQLMSSGAPPRTAVKSLNKIIRGAIDKIVRDRIFAVAAGVAFYGLFAIFPMIAAFVSLYGFIADPVTINGHVASLTGVLPEVAVDVIGGQVERIASQPRGRLGWSFLLGLCMSLWSANAGVKALFDGLNVAYDEEEKRSYFALNVESLAFTLAAMATLALALGALVILPVMVNFLLPGGPVAQILSLGRWPVLFFLVVTGLAALYRFGPSRTVVQWRWLSPGSIFAALVWLLASIGFSWYATNLGSFNETYGSLGAVIGFMTWLWISAAIILIGAEVNAEAEKARHSL